MGRIGSHQSPQQVPNTSQAQRANPAQQAAEAQQATEAQAAKAPAQELKDKLSGLLDKDTAEAITKAKMDPNSLDFKVPDKQHVRALKDALKALNQIPDETLQELNLGKMKTKIEEALQQLRSGNLSDTTVDKLRSQLNNLSEDVPGGARIRESIKDALQGLESMLDKPSKPEPTGPKPPPHMRPNPLNPDGPHIMKYASVFAK